MKKSKSEVHYSTGTPAEHCGNCVMFLPRDDACTLVEGHIVARMWCVRWSKKPESAKKAA